MIWVIIVWINKMRNQLLYKSMESYFSAIQLHLQDRVDIAVISNSDTSPSKAILSLGVDNMIFVKNLASTEQERINLPQDVIYTCISKAVTPRKCILGSEAGTVQEFDLQSKQTRAIYKSEFRINSLSSSPNNRYLAVGSQESKCVLVDLQTLKPSKCRPGHDSGVVSTCFSNDEKYIASIGMDKNLLIYNIQNFDQPLQTYRCKICRVEGIDPLDLSGTFNKLLSIYYAPGMSQLQIFQLLNSKWQYRLSAFIKHHASVIMLVKVIKTYLLITCSQNQFIIWNNKNEEKLVVIQNFTLNKVVEVGESFWGCKNDGKIYLYEKVLIQSIATSSTNQHANEKMQVQNNNQEGQNNLDPINFDQQDQDKEQDEKDDISMQQLKYEQQKKSKADKIITALPQEPVVNYTSLHDNSRYIHTSHYGYLIQKRQNQFQLSIQFECQDQTKNQILFSNKEVFFADFNPIFIAYANQTTYGIKFLDRFSDLQSWEKTWWDITAVACAYNWVAIANQQEIRILDITGNELKTICFDRQIIALAAHQNLLAVVHHESIPIQGTQCLAMQLYVVDGEKSQALKCSSCHVPIKPKSILKYFQFTSEGMLVSQDNAGFIRTYNLENNTWTSVMVEGIEDTRRLWLLGMRNYQLIYWKTSELSPDPQVFPRLPVKQSRVGISVSIDESQSMSQYPFMMFQRFCLDHQRCRSRLWLHLKLSRSQKHPGHSDVASIPNEKQLMKRHNQLDYKLFSVIKYYLKEVKNYHKALMAVKTLIRTIEAGKKFIDIFDDFKLRVLAVDLEIYYDQKQREIEYEAIQALELEQLKQQAEKTIKPKTQNNPFNRKKNPDLSSIPSLNNSQLSQASNFDNLSERSNYKQNGPKVPTRSIPLLTPQKQQMSNPFLKKRSTDQDMNFKSKEIEEQIQKFGVKRKAQINRKQPKF